MTVCVAVICEDTLICAMSDRMLTAGDVQFQPPSSKIWQVTSSIFMMSAGDIGLQTEIYTFVRQKVANLIQEKPTDWLRVEAVADLYKSAYFDIKGRRAERAILQPLGLDSDSFLARQGGMEPHLVSKIASELINYRMPDVSAIIAGNNPKYGATAEAGETTPHLFIVDNGSLSCADRVGFACVGVGAWHANSTMMLAGHNPRAPIPKGLLTAYTAKKRSEVAPGVGPDTDVYIVTSALGSFSELRDEIREAVSNAYEKTQEEITRAQTVAETSLNEHIAEILRPRTEPDEPQTTH